MNRRKLKTIIKTTLIILTVAVTPIISKGIVANASPQSEEEFNSAISKFKGSKIVVENGISLRRGEKLDLSKSPSWEMSDKDTVNIKGGIVTAKNPGTVYLTQKIGDKVHVIEIYVPRESLSLYSVRNPKVVNRNHYKVFIDPGHGGNDNGAEGHGLKEDELNLEIGLKLRNELTKRGIEVKISRDTDTYLSLGERANMANAYGADLFVSNHINSFDGSYANGIETFYHRDKVQYKPLSEDIQKNAIKDTGATDRGVKNANFAVLRESNMPSALFEAGFITNKDEAAKLKTTDYQNKLVKALADGIEKYLKDNITLKPEEEKPDVKPETVINTGVVTASSLNVRSGASTSNEVIGSLQKGSKVEIVGTANGWHKIKYGSGYGYVSADYIKIDSTKPEVTPDVKPDVKPEVKPDESKPEVKPETLKKGTVTASSLNVRSGASTKNKVIGSLKKGSTVEIVSTSKGWHKIKYGKGYGYVSSDYIKITTSSNTSKPENKPSTSKPETTKKGTITASSLNIRSGASTKDKVIGSLKKGSKVEIVSTSKGWHKIKFKNGYAYISADYVKVTTSSSTSNNKPSNTVKKGKVTASSLNVRNGASTKNKVIGSLKKGNTVEIVSTSKGWHKIKYKNSYGYVSADYVK